MQKNRSRGSSFYQNNCCQGSYTVNKRQRNQRILPRQKFEFARLLWNGASIKPGRWNIPEHPGTWNNYHNYEKKYVKLHFQQLNETKLNWYQLGKLKGKKKTEQNKTKQKHNKFKLKKKKGN